MIFNELKNFLANTVLENRNSYSAKIKSNKRILTEIYELTSFLPSHIKLKTRIYRIINGLEINPVCHHCGRSMNDRDIKNIESGYRKYCCPQCAKDSEDRKRLYSKTCMNLYGVPNASSSEAIKQKRINSNIAAFGVDNPAKSKHVIDRIRKTCLTQYGCTCSLHAHAARIKTENTNILRYGVKSYSQTAEFGEKTRSSNMKKFGVEYPNQNPDIRRKAQKRYIYEGLNFDSAPELALYIYAKDHGIEITYQPATCFKYCVDGKEYAYQPDFMINDRYVELKGIQFFENKDSAGRMINPYDRSLDKAYEAKHQCMIANGIMILTTQDYAVYIDYVNGMYGKDYLKKFKTK